MPVLFLRSNVLVVNDECKEGCFHNWKSNSAGVNGCLCTTVISIIEHSSLVTARDSYQRMEVKYHRVTGLFVINTCMNAVTALHPCGGMGF